MSGVRSRRRSRIRSRGRSRSRSKICWRKMKKELITPYGLADIPMIFNDVLRFVSCGDFWATGYYVQEHLSNFRVLTTQLDWSTTRSLVKCDLFNLHIDEYLHNKRYHCIYDFPIKWTKFSSPITALSRLFSNRNHWLFCSPNFKFKLDFHNWK